jgi:hypothetical protein
LLASSRMTAITKQMSSLADFILFDSPPMMEAADSSILAGRVDGALLVIHAGHTRPGAVRLAAERLRGSGVRVLGGGRKRRTGLPVSTGLRSHPKSTAGWAGKCKRFPVVIEKRKQHEARWAKMAHRAFLLGSNGVT